MPFIKHSAKNTDYISTKKILESNDSSVFILNEFKAYLENESNFVKTNSNNTSGKVDSYYRYIISLFVITKKIDQSIEFLIPKFTNFLVNIQTKEDFIKYNLREKGFPNATINSFVRFSNYFILENDELISSEKTINYSSLFSNIFSRNKSIVLEEKKKPTGDVSTIPIIILF